MFNVRAEAPLGLGHAVTGWGRLMMLFLDQELDLLKVVPLFTYDGSPFLYVSYISVQSLHVEHFIVGN